MNTRSFSTNITKKKIFILSIPVFFSNLAIPLVGMVHGKTEEDYKKATITVTGKSTIEVNILR